MAFNLIQLETFLVLARELNFTRAAEALDLTQPAVTQHVRALQRHFGVALVDLVGRRTRLTDAGVFLAQRAELLLGNVDALERDMREFADVRAGELRLGATVTIGAYALPEIVARFSRAHPDVRLHVEIANTDAMGLAVKNGRVSLALVEGPLADEELEIVPYADDELILVAPVGHPLAKRKRQIAVTDLEGMAFVARESGSGTRAQVHDGLRRAGIEPNVALTLPTGEGIARSVEAGIGIAFLSRLVVDAPIREGRLVAVSVRDLTFKRTFRTVRLRRQTPSPAALAFIESLKRPNAQTKALR